jgi:RsmE family RNA methyltransferase
MFCQPYFRKDLPMWLILMLSRACLNIPHACSVVVGPEGGFIPYEVDLLTKNGCQAVSLGNRILRTETSISYILGRLFS